MAADFNEPTVQTTYTAFPTQIIDNFDAALQQLSVGSPSNVPTGAIKFDLGMSGGNRWKKFDGTNYVDLTDHFNLNAKVTCTGLRLGDGASGGVNAIFLGDDNDLRIYHDNSAGHSFIRDFNGTGNLKICGSQVDIMNNGAGELMAQFVQNGSATLYHNNTARVATSGSGCSVTGNLTTTGSADFGDDLEIDGSDNAGKHLKIGTNRTGNANAFIDLIGDATHTTYGARFIRSNGGANTNTNILHKGTGQLNLNAQDAGTIVLETSDSPRVTVLSGGNVGVGLTNPSFKFEVSSSSSSACRIATTGNGANLELVDNDTTNQIRTIDGRLHISADTGNNDAGASQIRFLVDGGNKMMIDNNGQVGIGVGSTAPNRKLEISSNGESSIIRLSNTDTTIQNTDRIGMLEFHGSDAGASGICAFIEAIASSNAGQTDLRFATGTAGSVTEKVRLDSDGRLLFNVTSSINSNTGSNNAQPLIQVHSDDDGGSISLTRYGNNSGNGGRLFLQKARGAISSPSVVNDGDNIGEIRFGGYDGSAFANGCKILNRVNGTPSTDTLPSDLEFHIRDVNGSAQELLTLNHDRFVGINKASPSLPLHIKQLTDLQGVLRLEDSGSTSRYLDVDVTNSLTTFQTRFGNSYGTIRFTRDNNTTVVENLRLKSDGTVSIGTTATQTGAKLTVDGGNIVSSASVVAGFTGTGQAALTVNDGGGNCNVTFNHKAATPDNAGVAGRISVNTDAGNGADNVAAMDFQLNNNVSGGSTATTTSVFSIHRGRGDQIGGNGDVSTVYGQVRVPEGTTDGNIVGLCLGTDHDTGLCRTGSNKLGISSNNAISLEVGSAVRVAGELNLMGNTDESGKFIDIGFEGFSFQMRRTKFDDTGHEAFITVNASGVFSTANIGSTSDAKLKKNITTISEGAIENIKKLRPVKFDWIKEDKLNDNNGFIAQEVKEIFPNLVYGTEYDATLNDPEKGTKGGIKSEGYSIDLVGITANITKALQEAISKIESLETEVAALKAA